MCVCCLTTDRDGGNQDFLLHALVLNSLINSNSSNNSNGGGGTTSFG